MRDNPHNGGMSNVIGRPTRRLVLGAAAALLPFAKTVGAPALTLLAPAGYDDPEVLKALKGKGAAWGISPLSRDADSVDAVAKVPGPALVVAAHPWAPGVLWPEGVIAPLPEALLPATAGRLGDMFPPTATLERSYDGRDRLGVATRFDLAALLMRVDRVPRDVVDDVGLGILDDPALDGRIALFDDGRSLLACLMLYAGLDPFRLQLPSERSRFAVLIQGLVSRIALVTTDPKAVLAALADGRVDVALGMGLRHQAQARLAGLNKLVFAAPRSGPLAGRGAVGWIELASIVARDETAADAAAALGRLAAPATRLALARAGGMLQPVVGLDTLQSALSAAEHAALGVAEWPALTNLAAPLALIPEQVPLRAVFDQAITGRAKG